MIEGPISYLISTVRLGHKWKWHCIHKRNYVQKLCDQIGRIFAPWVITLARFLETTKVALALELLFNKVKVMHWFWQKMYWVTFCPILSQTHPVTPFIQRMRVFHRYMIFMSLCVARHHAIKVGINPNCVAWCRTTRRGTKIMFRESGQIVKLYYIILYYISNSQNKWTNSHVI
jgi:hypothetical protein